MDSDLEYMKKSTKNKKEKNKAKEIQAKVMKTQNNSCLWPRSHLVSKYHVRIKQSQELPETKGNGMRGDIKRAPMVFIRF